MRCKIKKDFCLGSQFCKTGNELEFTDEQISRLSEYIEPIEKNIDLPPEDKMIREPKKRKGGGKQK